MPSATTNAKEVTKFLEKITSRGHNHYQVFDDWLELMLTALMAEEKDYMAVMGRYANDWEYGNREADHFKEAFHQLMECFLEVISLPKETEKLF